MERKQWKSALGAAAGRHASRRGAFAAALMALAVAAAVVFNLLVAQLPERWSQWDLTNSGIYDITDTSVDYLSALDQDVEIHVLSDESSVDSRIVRFLNKYTALSDHLTLEYIDPLAYPSVLSEYGVDAGTVVVTCAATGLQESFAIDDIIGYDLMTYYYYGTKSETDFDGEGLLTSAVDAVVTEARRAVYQTSGHQEADLPDSVVERLEKAHLSVDTVNLLTEGGVPADCDLLILNAPVRDLADDELDMVLEYLSVGGHVVYTMADQLEDLPNLEAMCAAYGMTVADGFIADTQRYYQNNPYLFFPVIDTSVDVASGLSSDSLVLLYGARGFTLTDPERDTVTVSSFLTTSEDGHAIVDEANQTQGTYAVGAVATEELDDNISTRLTVFGSASLTDTGITSSFTNLDNEDLYVAALLAGFDDVSAISIASVSLSVPMNTVTTAGLWGLLFILVIPGVLLIWGFVRWMRRRRL